MKQICIAILGMICYSCQIQQSTSREPLPYLALSDSVEMAGVVIYYNGYDKGGNTSVANDKDLAYKWSGDAQFKSDGFGYFLSDGQEIPYIRRNRDLGQTFTCVGRESARIESITVRLGFGSQVVRRGMYGQSLSIQIFRLSGQPVLNNNGSDSTMKAYHGFPHNRYDYNISHERDDFYEGIEFLHKAVIRGFKFPKKELFGFTDDMDVSPAHENLKGKYLTFHLPDSEELAMISGERYAFLIMIDSIGKDRGFTLANHYNGLYPGGVGIRREGNGRFPPEPAHPEKPFSHPDNRASLNSAFLSDDFDQRLHVSPGTRGFPDVDTWRDLEFYIRIR